MVQKKYHAGALHLRDELKWKDLGFAGNERKNKIAPNPKNTNETSSYERVESSLLSQNATRMSMKEIAEFKSREETWENLVKQINEIGEMHENKKKHKPWWKFW
ncbi:MAG: hypothetical protein AEth_00524 [Candidatus Argoarchaeum ethanivorans]|uniref:Uncharacterized protein n=1 Tax=Candidatus Argoarchaeum ethanivorans TaxID=2608793 RepID=A0A8B3S406_9EURY|nr:MAG: hypothetical protein AEth_00524 [Candidatus Argoarchaeum ethanivorans]